MVTSCVVDRQGFHAEVRALLEDRLLDAAAEVIVTEGWGAVTMARIAEQVGISRQSLYKHVGSRQALGEAVISRETDRFLAGMAEQIAVHGDDPVAGLSAATDHALRTGANNALLKAVLTGGNGAEGDLLALLAVRSEPVLQRTITALLGQARRHYQTLDLPKDQLAWVVEVVARLTLSHLLQPTSPIERAVTQVRAVVAQCLHPPAVQPPAHP
jgi:AcrR family transcriptional regulator